MGLLFLAAGYGRRRRRRFSHHSSQKLFPSFPTTLIAGSFSFTHTQDDCDTSAHPPDWLAGCWNRWNRWAVRKLNNKKVKRKNWRRRYHRNWENNNRISFLFYYFRVFRLPGCWWSNMGSWTDPIKRSNTSTSHANTKPTILRHVFLLLIKIPWRIAFFDDIPKLIKMST